MHPRWQVSTELSREEAELQRVESDLEAQLATLAQVQEGLRRTQQQLAARAKKAGQGSIAQKVASTVIAPVPGADAFERSVMAREAAIRMRRAVVQEIQALSAELAVTQRGLEQQLAFDAKSLDEAILEASREAPTPPPAPAPVMARTAVGRIKPVPPIEKELLSEPSGIEAALASLPPETPRRPAAAGPARRQNARVAMAAEIDFGSDHNFFNGFSSNISDGGLFIATVNTSPLGTEVDLRFTLPTGERIEARGVVRWLREVNDQHPEAFPGMGVQFKALSLTAQKAIHDFCAQREPLFWADAA